MYTCSRTIYMLICFVIIIIITRKLSYRKDDHAMRRMNGCPEIFRESMTTPMATFPKIRPVARGVRGVPGPPGPGPPQAIQGQGIVKTLFWLWV